MILRIQPLFFQSALPSARTSSNPHAASRPPGQVLLLVLRQMIDAGFIRVGSGFGEAGAHCSVGYSRRRVRGKV